MLKFPTEAVDSHITRIYAFGTELMYLIEGTTKNVLIDTGSGFGSLKVLLMRFWQRMETRIHWQCF